ncbi:cation:proton antiporter [Methylacidiphilum caldifontis]|uniref:Potassium transporter Kef n=1 Tax=Methylacidiphilum caldifontis TaxID=2795386 RepID=A0A4Y8PFI2_9BACT|nr:cation:proton antiporter [Methylacidiphilum caldifontis]TFE70832.1 potassium transporter Kef [Methylacidiphilum caldifontis]
MEHTWFLACFWMGLALVASFLAIKFRISAALIEIIIGIFGQYLAFIFFGKTGLNPKEGWISFLAGLGAIMLTFMAGSELEPSSFRKQWKESTLIGLITFFVPFLCCALFAHFFFHWDWKASLLAGIALSATSVAVMYTVLLEFGLNKTSYGKGLLVACFINDLSSVLILGFLFAPFGWKTAILTISILICSIGLAKITPYFLKKYGNKPSELETKYLLFFLFGLGGIAVWAGSEAVLPAYLVGMALAKSVGQNHDLVKRLRTITLGILTPFYFIRAGSFVDLSSLMKSLIPFFFFFAIQQLAKFSGTFPLLVKRKGVQQAAYTTLLMSTGLTFNVICCLYGLSHGIITQSQYSVLIPVIISTAIFPTLIANRFFLPKQLLPKST